MSTPQEILRQNHERYLRELMAEARIVSHNPEPVVVPVAPSPLKAWICDTWATWQQRRAAKGHHGGICTGDDILVDGPRVQTAEANRKGGWARWPLN